MVEEIKKEEQPKKKMVEIEADDLKAILARLDNVEKDNEMLKYASDKGRLAKYEIMNQKDIIRTAKISFLKDNKGKQQAVVAWRTVQDDVYLDAHGIYHEDQVIEVTLEDDSKNKLRYIDFARLVEKKEGEIIKKKQTKDGEVFKIQMKDGKEYDLDIKFIN